VLPRPDFPKSAPPLGQGVRVLLLEDDPISVELVGTYLRRIAFVDAELHSAGTLAEALALLTRTEVDLVISDLNLPDSAGAATIEALVRAVACPVIAITSDLQPAMRDETLARGAYDFMQKRNLNEETLAQLVRLAAMQVRTFRSLRESEARFRSLSTLTSDWFWETDTEHRFVTMPSRVAGVTGLGAEAYVGKARWEIPGLSAVGADWSGHQQVLARRESFRDLELRQVRTDGGHVYLHISGEPVYNADGSFRGYRGTAKDVTARKHEETLLRLEHSVTQRLAAAQSAGQAIRDVMQALCESLGWGCGRFFALDAEAQGMRFEDAWATPGGRFDAFIESSRAQAYQRGVGLVGRVWESGRPLWAKDAATDRRVAYRGLAREHGLHSALVFPVTAQDRTIGVVSISSEAIREPDARLLGTLGLIGGQLGLFLQRCRAEEALRASESRLRAIMYNEPQCVKLLDGEGRLIDMNPAGLRMIEADAIGPLRGKSVYGLVVAEHRDAFRDLTQRVAGGQEGSLEFEIVGLKGTRRWLETRAVPLRDEVSGMQLVLGLTRDVTERRRAEAALRESEARFRQTFELAGSGVAHVSLEGRFLRVNRSLCRILGYSEQELVGRSVKEISHPDDRDATDVARQHVRMGEADWIRAQKRYLRKGGAIVWVELTVALARDAEGNPLYEIAMLEDITERKNAESALRESEVRYRTLTELTSDWYWEQDAELRFVRTGGSSDARGGITPQAHVGLCRWELPRTEIVGQSWDEHRRVLAAREPFTDLLLRRTSEQGEVHYVSVAGRPIFDAQGTFTGYRGVAKDVTNRIASEMALRESEARFRSLTDLSADFYWETDASHRVVRTAHGANHRPIHSGQVGKARWEIPSTRPDEAGWTAHRATLKAHLPFRDFELGRVDAEGIERHLSLSGEPVFDAAGAFVGYRGVGKEITARKREEALLTLEHTVTSCLAQAKSAAAGLNAVLRSICESQGWPAGRYFVVDEDAGVLRFGEAWGRPLPAVEDFISRSRALTYAPGQGLSGKVWQSGETLWVKDVSKDARSSGSSGAALQGGAFVFPVISGGKTIGVMSFSSADVRAPDARLLKAVGVIGSQVGQFLMRKKAEERQAAHLRYQERIARLGQSALGRRDRAELAGEAAQTLLEALRADGVAYIEPGPGERDLVVRSVVGVAGATGDARVIACPESDAVVKVLRSGNRLVADGVSLSLPWAQGLRSAAIVPVRGERGVRGALCVFFEQRGGFGAEDSVNFVEAVASLLSTGLQRIDSEGRLAHLAQFDQLTGLPNRTLLADRFSQMIVQAGRRGSPLAVLFVDLDEFKLVNDTLGHAGGDALLQEVAARLQSTVRAGDTVARISGDEFAIVLADLTRTEDAALVSQKIIERLSSAMEVHGKEVFVTASVGIAAFPADGADAEALLRAADAAMYRAKQAGRNAFQFFTPEINQRSRARAQMAVELRRALEREEFALVYQPKYRLSDRQVSGAEALLRWKHPERGTVSPAEFIPVLEETGLIVQVGEWVIRRACADLKAWQAAGINLGAVSVNLSARQFRQSDLHERIKSIVSSAGVDPALIELEITESQLMTDPDHAIRVMRALRDAGMRIAIDDFGTGYSSLSYLTRFPVAALKIDRSFVKDMWNDKGDANIVRTIVEMAHSLGFTVIAEGVETEQQAAFLRALRCEQAQGYLFARPMPADELRVRLSSQSVA
jgi:diguanylate cyclase (GGDEF)-like protein/PAS domain S-box-containing protein